MCVSICMFILYFLHNISRVSNTRDHDYKLYRKRNNNNVRANFFAERIVN